MSDTIGYLDAWRMWLSGQEVDPQLRMWFMSILWWGRTGKIAAFLGGGTVLLDLIGPERLRAIVRDRTHARKVFAGLEEPLLVLGGIVTVSGLFVSTIVVTITGAPSWYIGLTVFVLSLGTLAVGQGLKLIGGAIIRILDTDRPAQAIRYLAVILLFVGFHFDLLAS